MDSMGYRDSMETKEPLDTMDAMVSLGFTISMDVAGSMDSMESGGGMDSMDSRDFMDVHGFPGWGNVTAKKFRFRLLFGGEKQADPNTIFFLFINGGWCLVMWYILGCKQCTKTLHLPSLLASILEASRLPGLEQMLH